MRDTILISNFSQRLLVLKNTTEHSRPFWRRYAIGYVSWPWSAFLNYRRQGHILSEKFLELLVEGTGGDLEEV
jgi:hypothetical protein